MNLKSLFLFVISCLGITTIYAKDYKLASPNGQINVTVAVGQDVTYSIFKDGDVLLNPSKIALQLASGKTLGENGKVTSAKVTSHNSTFEAPVYKKKIVEDIYNQLTLKFADGYQLLFRAYDDGVAYRFVATKSKGQNVKNEIAQFNLPIDGTTWASYTNTSGKIPREEQFFNSFEDTYDVKPVTQLDSNHLMILPVLVETAGGNKICITESDLMNYPGMYLNNSTNNTSFNAVFAPVVKNTKLGGHNNLQMIPTAREDYIAKVSTAREFPWRVLVICSQDKDLAVNDMVYRTSAPSKILEQSWIKPGKVAWDRWRDWNIKNVDFKAGVNNDT